MEKIRAYEIGDYSAGLNVRMVTRPAPQSGFGEVVLKVHATGLNSRDLTLMRGKLMYGGKPLPPTLSPLSDNASEVLAVGPGVTRFGPSDRVTMTHFSLWIEANGTMRSCPSSTTAIMRMAFSQSSASSMRMRWSSYRTGFRMKKRAPCKAPA